MALEPKQKIYVKTKSNFNTLLDSEVIGDNHLVFIEDTQEVWTHGTFFSGRSFKSVSDGTTTTSSPSTSGTITFAGSGKASVAVSNNTVTITGSNATVATGDADGQVKIDGQNVSVRGLGTAAYTDSTAYTEAAHASDTSNPHSVTKAQVGLGNVTNDAQVKRTEMGAADGVATLSSAGKVPLGQLYDTLEGYGITDAYTKEEIDIQGEVIASALNDLNERALAVVDHVNNANNPHNVTAAQVGLGNVTNESKATMFTDAALTGTPTAPTAAAGTNTTQIATTAFVTAAVGSVIAGSDAMVFKGTIGSSGATVAALPDIHRVGDTYKVITAGTYAGAACEVGDMIICITDGTTANNDHWTVVQANIDGAVIGPVSSTAGHIATFSGATGKVIADSGYTIATSVPSGALFTDDSVTSVDNHYSPVANENSEITATAGTASNYASDTLYEVVTGVKAQRDAKGHVTGLTITTQKIKPGNKALKVASGSGTATTAITMDEGSADKTLTITGDGTWITGAVSGTAGAATVTLSHGAPSTGSALTTTDGTASAYASNTDYTVVTGITVSADTNGHITGVSTTRQVIKDTTLGSGITLTGYSKAAASSAVAATDTVNQAIGKLEYRLEHGYEWAEYN